MELIIFGIGFGLFIGVGLFFMLIRPALLERKQEQMKKDDEQ